MAKYPALEQHLVDLQELAEVEEELRTLLDKVSKIIGKYTLLEGHLKELQGLINVRNELESLLNVTK